MDSLLLTDKSVIPSEEIIEQVLKSKYDLWSQFTNRIRKQFPGVIMEWIDYRDSKCWLMPVNFKKKNIAWISLANGTTQIGFWFGKKVEPLFEQSNPSPYLMEKFNTGKQNKMGRGFTIFLSSTSDINEAMQVLTFKAGLK